MVGKEEEENVAPRKVVTRTGKGNGGIPSPPLEGWPLPADGVVNYPPLEGCPPKVDGVVNSLIPSTLQKEIFTTINGIPIYRHFVEGLPYNPALKRLLKDKRKAGILSEVLFWLQVHKGHFHYIDFDRQRIIGNYIVDFYVKTLGLVVEIDGSSHNDKVEYDTIRQQYLERLGLKVFRASDQDVKERIGEVMLDLEEFIIREYGK